MLTRSKNFKLLNRSEVDKTKMGKKSKENGRAAEEKSEWVIMVPDNFLALSDENKDSDAMFHKLPHPKSGQSTVFAFKMTNVYEMIQFKEEFRSWFVNDSVQRDGTFYILTPIDPLFLAIPFLESVATKGKYMTLEQTLMSNKYQSGLTTLENCLSTSNLEKVCDCKKSDDFTAFRLNTEKVISWLTTKVDKLAEHLKKEQMHVGAGSRSANFVKSSQNNEHSQAEYMHYSLGLVSDYLADTWVEKLKEKLNLQILSTEVKNDINEREPPPKRQKLNEEKREKCVEDYREVKSLASQAKKPAKLTSGQKKMAKIDKTGMKSLNSFFTSKQKGK